MLRANSDPSRAEHKHRQIHCFFCQRHTTLLSKTIERTALPECCPLFISHHSCVKQPSCIQSASQCARHYDIWYANHPFSPIWHTIICRSVCRMLCWMPWSVRPAIIIMQTIMHTSCFAPFSNNYYASRYAYKLFCSVQL